MRDAGVAEESMAVSFNVSVSDLRERLEAARLSEKQVLAIEV